MCISKLLHEIASDQRKPQNPEEEKVKINWRKIIGWTLLTPFILLIIGIMGAIIWSEITKGTKVSLISFGVVIGVFAMLIGGFWLIMGGER